MFKNVFCSYIYCKFLINVYLPYVMTDIVQEVIVLADIAF